MVTGASITSRYWRVVVESYDYYGNKARFTIYGNQVAS